jgi:hypothetical protein
MRVRRKPGVTQRTPSLPFVSLRVLGRPRGDVGALVS